MLQEILKKANGLMGRLERELLSWSIILLAALTVGNIISRKLFNYSWSFTEEISQFILVLVTFISVSYGARKGRHICMTALYEQLNERTRKVFTLIISAVTAAILFYLSYYAMDYVLSTWKLQKTTPVLRIPFYLVIACVPVGLFIGGIQYLLTLVRNITTEGIWLSFEEKAEFNELDTTVDITL